MSVSYLSFPTTTFSHVYGLESWWAAITELIMYDSVSVDSTDVIELHAATADDASFRRLSFNPGDISGSAAPLHRVK